VSSLVRRLPRSSAPFPAVTLALGLLGGGALLAAGDVRSTQDVVVVVSADSPLLALSRGELTDIFLGRTARFPDGRSAVPLDQRDGSSARAEFYSAYLGRSPAQIKAHWSKAIFTGRGSPPRAVPESSQLRARVASDPSSIGYLPRDQVDAALRIVRIE
jgi:ABC-type phosphate transport system substrate-binding protein